MNDDADLDLLMIPELWILAFLAVCALGMELIK